MEPITRSEMLMDGQYVEPKTRKEMILAGEDLEPVTREEYFLKKYRHSGGDVDVVQLTATENKTYTAPEGKAYNPVKVNVPEKKLTTLNADENKTYSPPSGYDGFSEVTVYVPYVTQGTTINENGTYTPPEGVDGFGRVIVDVPTPPPSLQSLTASHNGYFLPSSGYVGFSEVNVDVALPQNAYLLESQKNDVVTIQHGAEFDMPKLIASIEPQQSGSGDPSPENVRPISGWTACNVVRTGKNLFDGSYPNIDGTVRYRSIYVGDGSFSFSTNAPLNSSQSANLFAFSGEVTSGGSTITNGFWSGANKTFNSINGYITIAYRIMGDVDPQDYNVQIEKGSATPYEPFGNTYTINFVDGSNPLTVYGGTLNVLSGGLTVDRRQRDLGDFTYTYDSTHHRFRSSNIYNLKVAPVRTLYMESSCYQCMWHDEEFVNIPDASFYNVNDGTIWVHDSRYTSGTDLKTALTGQSIVFPMETPQTYQLTPTEVKSLLGVNNIFADTGEVDVQIWTKEV